MIVVADTSPILYLVLIETVQLLQSFYGEVVMPDAVATELRATKSPSTVRTWISNPPSWVKVRPVTREQLDAVIAELDAGERAAIALATALSANLLLIDDARGRAEARRRDLAVTGTLGVLRTAAERGLIDVPDALAGLRTSPSTSQKCRTEQGVGTGGSLASAQITWCWLAIGQTGTPWKRAVRYGRE